MEERIRPRILSPTLPVPKVIMPRANFPFPLVGYQVGPALAARPTQASRTPEKAHVSILPELCKGCELCVFACPSGNLAMSSQLNRNGYHPVVFSYDGTKGPCSACGICYWVCPDFAISEIRRLKQ